MIQRLLILGISGNIGSQAIDVINEDPSKFSLEGFSLGNKIDVIPSILKTFKNVKSICVKNQEDAYTLKNKYPHINFYYGDKGLLDLIENTPCDLLLNALVGFVGLLPTLKAIEKDINIALANKESLVVGGELVNKALKHSKSVIYPVDSEHSAIYKCYQLVDKKDVSEIILTASGGAFRDLNREELKKVTPKEALKHPTWKMGDKVTVDSASMLNKGFELIEAHYLFDVDIDNIKILMHKESYVHSLLHLKDNRYVGEVNKPSMKNPIRYALSYEKEINHNEVKIVNKLEDFGKFTFKEFTKTRYPMVGYAIEAFKMGGTMPTVLNAVDEVAVDLFLKNMISFLDIENVISLALKTFKNYKHPSIDRLIEVDKEAREWAKSASLIKGSL